MFEAVRTTEKLYYRDQYLMSAAASIVRIHPEAIELDRTIAYPEGGGQEADIGWLDTPVGRIRFIWVKKLYGTPLNIEGFKGGKAGGVILHMIHPDDLDLLKEIELGMPVTITIDPVRRERLTVSHSASHFLYAAILEYRPELNSWTTGCHIKEDGARFDFLVDDIFTPEDVDLIKKKANQLIELGLPIENVIIDDCCDARLWRYGEIDIPCGGTHLQSPHAIGPLQVHRKKLGRNKERLICSFEQADFDITRYGHEP
ncbi:alanyl-tRNA editing protein [Azotobacter armeniacus]